MKKAPLTLLSLILASTAFGKATIDADVIAQVKKQQFKASSPQAITSSSTIALIIFLHSSAEKKEFLKELNKLSKVSVQELSFMPAVAVTIPADLNLINKIAKYKAPAQISSIKDGSKELEISAQAIQLTPSIYYPEVSNWWAHGYTGNNGIIGIIDDGIDPGHPALANKKLITLVNDNYFPYPYFYNGVRTAHGTGIACIYASNDEQYKGIAYGASTIISGLSGEENPDERDIMMTLNTLDWMVGRSEIKPTIINYSIGHGYLSCPLCPEWSGLAKIIDEIVNQEKILWVKSAGNRGYIKPTQTAPFASTLTVPADSYNALTVGNMDTATTEEGGLVYRTANRDLHRIRTTSSRGPTPFGRRKPDLVAPGHNIRTCAPDPQAYHFKYSPIMDYHDGYRLMGGTSAAAPHVGAAALLLQDAGIHNPMAIRALLINSADAWTDHGGDSEDEHFQIMGSEWNRTYGWGYLNMQKAFDQRSNIIEDQLTLENPVKEYETTLDVGDKITLVHERRVGYFENNKEWRVSHLALEVIDKETHKLLTYDDSPMDTVHQVANCDRLTGQKDCSAMSKPIQVLVRVKLLSSAIDGNSSEPFALVLKPSSRSDLGPTIP